MGANRGGAQTLTPPTLQGHEPSPLLRAVSCPRGCFASHAHPAQIGTQVADRNLANSSCPLTTAKISSPFLPWTTGKGQLKEKAVSRCLPLLSSLIKMPPCFVALLFFLAFSCLFLPTSHCLLCLSLAPSHSPFFSSSSFPIFFCYLPSP